MRSHAISVAGSKCICLRLKKMFSDNQWKNFLTLEEGVEKVFYCFSSSQKPKTANTISPRWNYPKKSFSRKCSTIPNWPGSTDECEVDCYFQPPGDECWKLTEEVVHKGSQSLSVGSRSLKVVADMVSNAQLFPLWITTVFRDGGVTKG